jgi:hypothetical protein
VVEADRPPFIVTIRFIMCDKPFQPCVTARSVLVDVSWPHITNSHSDSWYSWCSCKAWIWLFLVLHSCLLIGAQSHIRTCADNNFIAYNVCPGIKLSSHVYVCLHLFSHIMRYELKLKSSFEHATLNINLKVENVVLQN